MIGIFGNIKKALAIAGAFALSILLTALTFKRKGQMQERVNNQVRDLEGDRDANRRMNNADVGADASDDDNVAWLEARGKK